VEGWSAARQRVREVEGDGGRGTGSLCATCGCSKQRGHGRKSGEGVDGQRHENEDTVPWEQHAPASGVGTNCSHEHPDLSVRPDVRTLVVSFK
jgi:hypothetical protein